MRSQLRFILTVLLLAGTALFLRSRGQAESLPPRQPLDSFPLQVGAWEGKDLAISEETRLVLGDGEFLQRIYGRNSQEPYIDLFIAYFPTQRTGSTMHSPQNCLPGSGWTPLEKSQLPLAQPNGRSVIVNRYVIAKGLNHELVLYWYQAHGRVVASEYWAKFYLVADSIRMNRSDGALVRLLTPLLPGESVDSGQARVLEFARAMTPTLESYVPR